MANKIVFFCLVCVAAMTRSALGYDFGEADENFDCESMMENQRLVNGIVECLLSEATECGTVMFTQAKKYAPEILETVCAKCTDKQRENFKVCTNKFIKIRPDDYEKILKKYDPDNKYRGPLEAFLQS